MTNLVRDKTTGKNGLQINVKALKDSFMEELPRQYQGKYGGDILIIAGNRSKFVDPTKFDQFSKEDSYPPPGSIIENAIEGACLPQYDKL